MNNIRPAVVYPIFPASTMAVTVSACPLVEWEAFSLKAFSPPNKNVVSALEHACTRTARVPWTGKTVGMVLSADIQAEADLEDRERYTLITAQAPIGHPKQRSDSSARNLRPLLRYPRLHVLQHGALSSHDTVGYNLCEIDSGTTAERVAL